MSNSNTTEIRALETMVCTLASHIDALEESKQPAKNTKDTWLDRVKLEQVELQKKLDDLTALLAKDRPDYISEQQWTLMERQQFHMALYNSLLLDRIEVA